MSSKVTSKGQITVPKPVRDALGIQPGDRLAFCVHENGTVTVEAETVDLRALRGILKANGKKVSIQQMHEAVRNRAGRK